MPLRNYVNTSKEGQLQLAIGTGDTTLTLTAPGLVNIPAAPFYVRIDPDTASEEIILVGAGSSATSLLNCTRGYDGTSAFSHSPGAKVRHCVAAEFYAKADAHVEASTNVHGLSGGAAVVGTTQTQTVTNKTINSSTIDVAHTTSPAASQAVKVSADAATGRDGFVWDNTAGSTGRSVVVRSGGVDRFIVTGVGLVTSNSATATDKALSVQHSAVERLFIQADGHVDIGLQAGGATVDRVRIRTQNTQNALAIKDSGGFNIFTIGGSGNVDASGYLATAGNLTATGNLSVTGTSTLTGDVTMPLPAASVTPRILVNSRSAGRHFEGRNQAGTATAIIDSDGGSAFNGKMFIHNGGSPVVAKVSGTGAVPTPTTGMFIIDDSDSFLKRYNGATWDAVIRLSSGLHARYTATAAQSIPNTAATKLDFPNAVTTTGDISVATNNTFTLNRAGLYMITTSVGWTSAAGDTFRSIQIGNSAGTARYAEASVTNSALSSNLSTSTVRSFTAGSTISIFVYQESGGALNTNPFSESTHVSLTWLRI